MTYLIFTSQAAAQTAAALIDAAYTSSVEDRNAATGEAANPPITQHWSEVIEAQEGWSLVKPVEAHMAGVSGYIEAESITPVDPA